MSYKTLLVSLNEIERLDAVLGLAASLAGAQKSHVLGLYVIPAPAVYPAVGPYVVPEVFDGLTRYFEEQSKGARRKFESAMKRHELSFQWLEVKALTSAISDTVSEMGRVADLVVVSETNRDGRNGVELDFVICNSRSKDAPCWSKTLTRLAFQQETQRNQNAPDVVAVSA